MDLNIHTFDLLVQLDLVIFDDFEYFNGDQLEKAIKIIWMAIPVITFQVGGNGIS